MAITAAQLEAEMDAVFAQMQNIRSQGKVISASGRTLTNHDLPELQKQYDWLAAKLSQMQSVHRSAVAAFRDAS